MVGWALYYMKNYYKNFNWKTAEKIIHQALKEDVGSGDITSDLLIPENKKSKAELLLKGNSVIAGLLIFKKIFNIIDNGIQVNLKSKDGYYYKKGKRLALISGSTKNILKGERVALNILQRMSGIPNATYKMKKKLNNKNIKIIDTRKTTPNFRIFEKLAVKIGGGENHRMGLYDMILIKDNHIEANDGIEKTLRKLKNNSLKRKIKIEIEVKNLKQFETVQNLGRNLVDIVMLDNFDIGKIIKAVINNKNNFLIELSGGISLKNIEKYSKLKGIDYISSGSLTHSVNSTDISLNFVT